VKCGKNFGEGGAADKEIRAAFNPESMAIHAIREKRKERVGKLIRRKCTGHAALESTLGRCGDVKGDWTGFSTWGRPSGHRVIGAPWGWTPSRKGLNGVAKEWTAECHAKVGTTIESRSVRFYNIESPASGRKKSVRQETVRPRKAEKRGNGSVPSGERAGGEHLGRRSSLGVRCCNGRD